MSRQNFLNYFGSKRKLNEENNREVQPPKKKSNEKKNLNLMLSILCVF